MKARYITALAIIAFLLHIVWENGQAPLYAGYQSISQHFPMCLIGTVGDVAITLSVLALVRLFKKSGVWTAADFSGLAIIGFIVAVVVEQHALLAGKWTYASAMPIIPLLKVGLAPVAQMTLLLPLSFYLAGLCKNSYRCRECGLKYADKKTAEQCLAWCKEHKTCNLDIIKNAVEDI